MRKMVKCEICHKGTYEFEIAESKTYRSKKIIRYYCKPCMKKIFKWEDMRLAWEEKNNSTT